MAATSQEKEIYTREALPPYSPWAVCFDSTTVACWDTGGWAALLPLFRPPTPPLTMKARVDGSWQNSRASPTANDRPARGSENRRRTVYRTFCSLWIKKARPPGLTLSMSRATGRGRKRKDPGGSNRPEVKVLAMGFMRSQSSLITSWKTQSERLNKHPFIKLSLSSLPVSPLHLPSPLYTSPSPLYTSPPPLYTSPSPLYTSPSPLYTSPSPLYTSHLPSTPPRLPSTPPLYTSPSPRYTSPLHLPVSPLHLPVSLNCF
ncbi:hypothetical protein NHX12_021460 [Muraenolepis orangiensis]|uniref:Uncharacterized protein n=1 Tax=Muraenolepis orangiensis TaxID=630683 RepID=A0A9Q0EQ43_9TELE|nr:hypothetical protein NHX12_021460 [Muraenolepis orangiensis]